MMRGNILGMTWIKHYTGLPEKSMEVYSLFNKFGHDGYGKYWHLMSILGQLFKDDVLEIKLQNRFLRDCLRFKSKDKMESFLLSTEMKTIFNTRKSEDDFIFETSILLELQSRDFKKARSKRGVTAYKKKNKNKEKEEDILILRTGEKTIFDDVIQSWNLICSGKESLKPVLGLKPNTAKVFFELLKINPELKKVETWATCFESVKNTPFLNGNSPSGFVATLNWLIESHKIIDVLNGQFGGNKNESSYEDFEKYMIENGVVQCQA